MNPDNMKTLMAIILASGKGKRFGMPKAEAMLEGQSFLQKICNSLDQAGLAYLVARYPDTEDMLATLRRARAELLLQNSNDGYSGLLVFPVDYPLVRPQTLASLAKVHYQSPEAVIRPVYNGLRGHPIVIPVSLELGSGVVQQGLKEIIRLSGMALLDLSVDDPGITRNINTQEDLWTPKN